MNLNAKLNRFLDRFVARTRWLMGKKSLRPLPPDESLGPAHPGEIRPPWIEHPGFESWDGYWRQSGEFWLAYTWEPYYNSLTTEQQQAYLSRWKVPEEWMATYFNPEWRTLGENDDE